MTGRAAIVQVLEAYRALEALGTEIEDEWQYVTDLAQAFGDSLAGLADRLGDAELPAPVWAALQEVMAEIALISDPHRAIDWLSTFPNVVALAVGVPLWGEASR